MLRSVSATTSRPAAAAAVARSNGSARRSSVAVAAKQGWSDADADEAPITKRCVFDFFSLSEFRC